ncbi:unnamed protein product [Echinostoma caproni]|uniref:Pkinase_Tyr domain-containing protein n=1 Tax=Echinostoma caproni TaxID=27848 RepID=A0A183AG66_9TREM|nr:unnamed protein product [Echinostoma caproni]
MSHPMRIHMVKQAQSPHARVYKWPQQIQVLARPIPEQDMKGAQILAMLDQGLRLSRPSRCPESIYSLMQQCWNFEGVRRPTFAELVLALSRILRVMPQPNPSPSSVSASSCETDTSTTLPPASNSESMDPIMYSQGKRNHCSGSGGSGVNSGASDGPPF